MALNVRCVGCGPTSARRPSCPGSGRWKRPTDANLWFVQGDQRISVARFLRGAFLAQVFKGSDLDAVAVADSLDQGARKGAMP